MIIKVKYKNMFKIAILLCFFIFLVGFLLVTHNLTESVLKKQWQIYQLTIAYYNSRPFNELEGFRQRSRDRYEALAEATIEDPFFKLLRTSDDKVHSILTFLEKGHEADHEAIEGSLIALRLHMEEHIERQLSTIRRGTIAIIFTLLLMVGIALYLYYRNKDNVKQLEKALKDKDFLIKEVHHRVKNNLAMIIAFINLQSDKIENPEIIQDIKNQVRAISTVHQKLYQNDEVSAIHLPRYMYELVSEIFYSLSHTHVGIDISMNEVYIDPDRAIPLGLIISELATNAVKHGLDPEFEGNMFKVSIIKSDLQYTIKIENNGHPFPENIDIYSVSTLGLNLIQNLVHQLHGTLVLDRHPHTCFTITFPVTP